MDAKLAAILKSIALRMLALKDGKDNTDPEERITVEQFIADIQEDLGAEFRNMTVYPDWSHGTVVGVDMDLLVNGKYWPVRFITQNPNTNSKWAEMARAGDGIVWLLNQNGNKEYWGVIHNGVYHSLRKRDTMKQYVTKLVAVLPSVSAENISAVISMAGNLGMLK